jgi:ribosomal protein S27AE
MTSPSETQFNLKEREYYCEKEKKFFILRAINPSCPDCGRTLVVALRSLLDDSRITGNDELAATDYRATSRIRKP